MKICTLGKGGDQNMVEETIQVIRETEAKADAITRDAEVKGNQIVDDAEKQAK